MIKKLTAEQIEALIQYEHDEGSRCDLAPGAQDTESRVELECYVLAKDLDLPRESVAA